MMHQSQAPMPATSEKPSSSSCSTIPTVDLKSQFIPQRLPSNDNFFVKLKAKCSSLQQQPRDGKFILEKSSSSLSITPPPSYRERNRSRASSLVSRAPSYEELPTTYINAITFDGGGIRGAATAKVVDILMDDLSKATGTEVHAADYFDMFAGTSTGGLIAMMLGRLRVPTKKLLDTYSDLSSRLFRSRFKVVRSIFQGCKYSGTLAERLFAKIVSDNAPEGADAMLRNKEFGAPDVFVTAVDANDASGKPLILRSYEVDDDGGNAAYEHRIMDAARATTAAPAYFPAMKLGNGQIAIDGGLSANNPTDLLISEARRKHGRGVRFGLLLSIGTGEKAPMTLPTCSSAVSLLSFTKAIGHILTDSEKTHIRVEERFLENDLGTYLRINVPGIGDVKLDDYKSIAAIVHETELYMNTPEMIEVRKAVVDVLLNTQSNCRTI